MNTASIRVPLDYEGLKTAVFELLEYQRTVPERERLRKLAETAANAEKLLADAEFKFTLSEGYYDWVAHLAKVQRAFERGVLRRVMAEELAGFNALEAGRAEHERAHPPCPECGAGLDRPQSSSCRCGWKKKAAA